MKFRIKVGEFIEQITQAAITVDLKSGDQPNSKIYLRTMKRGDTEVLYYFSTNQISKTFIRSDVKVESEGDVLVEGAKLLGGLMGRAIDQEVLFDATGDSILVKIGRSKFEIPKGTTVERLSKEADSLPFKTASVAKIQASFLGEVIRRSTFFIPTSSNGQQRFAMDVLHLKSDDTKGYVAYATDGNILSVHRGERPNKPEDEVSIPSYLIPQEALNPLQKLLGKHKDEQVELVAVQNEDGSTRELFFRMSGVFFGCKLRTGKHPNIQMLVDQHSPAFSIKASKDALKSALTRASNFVNVGSRWVVLSLDEDNFIKIKAGSSGDRTGIDDEVETALLGGSFTKMQITVDLDYFANSVQTLAGDDVILGFSPEKQKALVVRGETRNEDDKITSSSIYAISPIKPTK